MGKTIPNSKPLSPPSTFAIGSNNKIEQKPYYDPAAWNMVGCKERAKPTNSVKQQKEEKHFMDTKSLSPSTVLVNRSEESLNPFYRAAVQRWKQHKGIEQRDQRKTANFYASDSSYGRNQKHPSGTMFGDSIMKDMEESSDEEMTDTYFAQGIPKQDESDFEDEDDEISDDSMDYSDEEFSADDSSDEYYSDDDGYSDLEERLPKFPPYVPKPAYNAKGELVSGILKKRPSDENLSREGPTAAPKPAKKSLSWNPMAKARLFKRESGLDQYDAVTLPVTDAETLITDNNIAYRLSDEYKQKLWRESMKCTEACRQVKYHPKFTEKKDNSDTETNGVCPSCWEEAVRWLNKFRKHLNNARSNGGKVVKSTTFPNTRRPLPKRKLTSNYRQCHSIATFGNASAVNPWGMKKSKRISDDAVRQALTQVKLKSNLREKAARAGGIHARILYHLTIAPQRHSLT